MAAPKGNKNALGNRGGRRPAEKEFEWQKEVWQTDTLVRDLEAKIASGVYGVRDVYLLRALKADPSILRNLADKVLATLLDHSTNGKDLPQPILGYVPSDDSNAQDHGNEEADSGSAGGDISEQNGVDTALSDNAGAERQDANSNVDSV